MLCALTFPVAVVERQWAGAALLLGAAAGSTFIALASRRFAETQDSRLDLAGVAVAYTVLNLAAAPITYLLARWQGHAELADPVSAWFETVSGTTTTGLTMASDPTSLSATLQFWRSISQWTGAAGVVIFALLVAEPSGDRDSLPDWAEQPGGMATVAGRRILLLMGGLAAVCAAGLLAAGDPPWRAVNHALSASATGGFTITRDSLASSSTAAQIVVGVVVLLSAVSFGTLWDVLKRQGGPWYRRTQIRWALGLFTVTAAASLLLASGQVPLGGVLFGAASASATAGFSVGSAHRDLATVATIAIATMFVGGAAGSTAGGVKIARLAWVGKALARWAPKGGDLDDGSYRWDGESVEPKEAMRRTIGAGSLFAVFASVIAVGTIALLAMLDRPIGDAVFEATSATAGVGLSSGVTAADLSSGPKLVLGVLMLVGRVECTAFLALGAALMGRPRRGG